MGICIRTFNGDDHLDTENVHVDNLFPNHVSTPPSLLQILSLPICADNPTSEIYADLLLCLGPD